MIQRAGDCTKAERDHSTRVDNKQEAGREEKLELP